MINDGVIRLHKDRARGNSTWYVIDVQGEQRWAQHFPFNCRLLFIISTHKLAVSCNLLAITIVLSCFCLLIFYFEKFSTRI